MSNLPGTRRPDLLAKAALSAVGPICEKAKEQASDLQFFRSFFSTWLRVDITAIATAITVFSYFNNASWMVKDWARRIWSTLLKYFTTSISLPEGDDLNRDVLNWIGANVLERRTPRSLAAQSRYFASNSYAYRSKSEREQVKMPPIQYLASFETVWFVYDRKVFLVNRIFDQKVTSKVPHDFDVAPTGREPLIIMTLGRSVEPIKRFFEMCRETSAESKKTTISVKVAKVSGGCSYWSSSNDRPMRPLETVHFDESVKADLIDDIERYMDPSTRRYYVVRGIPYRRGYLLHGPPGTGKTSLCLALATYFDLDLYLLHLPGVPDDEEVGRLFSNLPPQCIVLLEDIDAVGVQRKSPMDEMEEEERKHRDSGKGKKPLAEDEEVKPKAEDDEDDEDKPRTSRVTLAGLLNVLDGVTSKEGRIVIMTSNFANRLDKALTRPGRIDRQVFLGCMSPESARLMFLRMFAPDPESPPLSRLDAQKAQELAEEFGKCIPGHMFTPAQLQGFLITHRHSAENAVKDAERWVKEEQESRIEAAEKAKRLAVWKAKKLEAEEATASSSSSSVSGSSWNWIARR